MYDFERGETPEMISKRIERERKMIAHETVGMRDAVIQGEDVREVR